MILVGVAGDVRWNTKFPLPSLLYNSSSSSSSLLHFPSHLPSPPPPLYFFFFFLLVLLILLLFITKFHNSSLTLATFNVQIVQFM